MNAVVNGLPNEWVSWVVDVSSSHWDIGRGRLDVDMDMDMVMSLVWDQERSHEKHVMATIHSLKHSSYPITQ